MEKGSEDQSAEEWKKLGICRIGWEDNFCKCRSEDDVRELLKKKNRDAGRSRFIWRFLKMKKGDIVLAYCRKNVIAYVGTITGRCEYNTKNRNYRKTRWWEKPYYFSRHDLPVSYSGQFLRQGEVVKEIVPDARGVEGFKKSLETDAISDSTRPSVKEDTIKADIRKHLHKELNMLEEGLTIKKAERPVGESRLKPDFIGEDKQGRPVLIECKEVADARTVEQVLGYGKRFNKGPKPRLFIVASRVTEECLKQARKVGNVELFETELNFRRKN
jgi:hypothetical protein